MKKEKTPKMLFYTNFPFIRELELVSKLFYFFSCQFLPENRAFVEHIYGYEYCLVYSTIHIADNEWLALYILFTLISLTALL